MGLKKTGSGNVQILERNVQILGDLVKVVPAALVTEGLARKGVTVNFAAANKQEYWAFRVIPDEEVTNDMDVHRVPTYSLADIQVRLLMFLSSALHSIACRQRNSEFLGVVFGV